MDSGLTGLMASCRRNSHTPQYAYGPCVPPGTPTVPTLSDTRNCATPRPTGHTPITICPGLKTINQSAEDRAQLRSPLPPASAPCHGTPG